MGFFIFLVVAVIVIVVVVKIVKSIMEQKEIDLNNADVEVTNQRLKEAANSGADPQTVVGYRAIEQVDGLRNSEGYLLVKKICMELLKRGYSIWRVHASHWDDWYDEAYIGVEQEGHKGTLGTINWYERVRPEGKSRLNNDYANKHINQYPTMTYRKHLIQYFPFLLIDSETPCTESPPEWLKICADIMRYSVEITEPEWVQENPTAREYVNVVFR